MFEVLGILALTIVAPIWILSHYITQWKLAKGLSKDEAQLLEELWQTAQRMESRINSLETIFNDNLDAGRKNA